MAIIEVQDLVKRYGSHTAVNKVSFAVEQGEIFGILGPNGAGKTTTVECIEGLRRPDGGTARVAGLDPRDESRELRQLLGVQLQESELPDKLRVGEIMRLYSAFYPEPADWRELIEALGLRDKLGTQFRGLSGGQKQRLSIALAMLGQPARGGAGRAHHRAGPAGPTRYLGPDRAGPRPRRDHPAGHPLHGGG
ncbi:ABC transporter ATP-binding protein [Ruania zhangjianzhongii]|uniref:ABC transporter ATP-binding protein n=1 Tax=Ruania zhangjianzhongii TaxID=2603206 RepID=UPI0031450F6A